MRVANASAPTDAVNLRQVEQMLSAAVASAGSSAIMERAAFTTDRSAPDWRQYRMPAAETGDGSASRPNSRSGEGEASKEDGQPSPISGWASVNLDGTLSGARNVARHARRSLGKYEITFKRRSVRRCAFNTALGDVNFIAVKPGTRANSVKVETRHPRGRLTDTAFYLMAVC